MFAVTFLSQFMQSPRRAHWEEFKHVFCYLKGTINQRLTIGNGGQWGWAEPGRQDQIRLKGFSDTDGVSQHHWHSISGYVFTIDGGAVSWSSNKQPIVVLSTTEAEYIAATHVTKEALWIRMFLAEIAQPLAQPVTLYCDNQSVISISRNDQFHAHTKHIDIRYQFICNVATRRLISVHYCPTNDMPADMLTKALSVPQLTHLHIAVGLRSA
jgi:hypothetical protein